MKKFEYSVTCEDMVLKYTDSFEDLPDAVYVLLSLVKELGINWACLKSSLASDTMKIIKRRPK